jgi:hypothetical protein
MRRKPSSQSFKSDSGPEDLLSHPDNEDRESIYVADATSSGTLSDGEKEYPADDEEDEGGREEEVTEGTSLLAPSGKAREKGRYSSSSFYGVGTIKDKFGKEGDVGVSQSLPDVVYASPVRPHLPSPSASNRHSQGTQLPPPRECVPPFIPVEYANHRGI